MCVCRLKLQVKSVIICNCHERRWFIESGDHLGSRERTRDNLVCLTVSSRHRNFSRSGKCTQRGACRVSCYTTRAIAAPDSGVSEKNSLLAPQMQWVDARRIAMDIR